jgi:hypothetical protein
MATKTKTPAISALAAYAQVATEVEKIDNSKPVTVAHMDFGDNTVQGDLYITRLDREIPGGKPTSRKLAPGDTQGSRHVAAGDCDVLSVSESEAVAALNRLVPDTRGETLFIGPMILARGPVTLEHPEHAWQTLPGDSVYLVTYQRTWAQEIRRTLD